MLFNSFTFMIFLPVVFLLYWFVFKRLKWQNLLILVASYVFYGWWDWRFLILIVITSLSSYVSGLLIKRYEGQRGRQKAVSAANIVLNLGILATFKYFNFFVGSMGALLHTLGMEMDWPTMRIILPVGISFYTFQALSYSIDVYTRKIEPTRDIIAFFSFISFFPQLVAGPIERATSLLPQILRERKFDYGQAVDGLRQMLWGLFKKLIIADTCAEVVNQAWDGIGSQPVSKVKVVCDTIYNRIPEDNYEAVFDASGNLSMLRALYTDGRTMNYESYVYDNEGRLDEILLLDQDSSLTGRYHYEYDGSFISKCTLYGMNNQDIQTWVQGNRHR